MYPGIMPGYNAPQNIQHQAVFFFRNQNKKHVVSVMRNNKFTYSAMPMSTTAVDRVNHIPTDANHGGEKFRIHAAFFQMKRF